MGTRIRPSVLAFAACFLVLVQGIAAAASAGGGAGEVGNSREVRAQGEATSAAPPSKQPSFLAAIGVPAAWRLLAGDVAGTIAVVDTGVDLKSAALKPYLTSGINLLDGSKPPQDDNGHGTAVAGILAEIAGAASSSSSGASWKMKIMPVKALDRNGEGEEADLARGIRYAVEHGADIVVLSLGLRRDSPEMRQVVELAESKGVLLVAAVGNNAAEFGTKAAVQYPAAYPTVLAVAGSEGTKAESRSTSGTEVDVSAPWQVETLKLGGGTTSMEGTSMSAPQAAGVAAMLRARRPEATPAQLRDLLRRTAQDIAAKGWDRNTGYGLIRADRAVQAAGDADWREPNDSLASASVFPLGSEIVASWSSPEDVDGYTVDIPYDGEWTAAWQIYDPAYSASKSPKPNLRLYPANSSKPIDPSVQTGSSLGWKVTKGKYYLRTSKGAWGGNGASGYRLVSSFAMGPDPMEPNPNALAAYTLAPRSQTWTGTFDSQGDEDWVVVTLPKQGKLRIRVETDTTRIDPAILVQHAGESAEETDNNGDGKSEEIVIPNASAGKYYIRVRNAVSSYPDPVVGTYKAQLEYITAYEDQQEPNDGPLSATPLTLTPSAARQGAIDTSEDKDWYRFSMDESHRIRVRLGNLPDGTKATVRLFDKRLAALQSWSNAADRSFVDGSLELEPGTYYLSIEADRAFNGSYYELTVRSEPPGPFFTDIDGHWAERQIRAVAQAGWMVGYAGNEFGPERYVTRAEATVIAVRAFRPKAEPARMRFTDVAEGYWAYSAIRQADAAKWLGGIAGPKFEPGRSITRGEAVILFARGAGLSMSKTPKRLFSDVPSGDPVAGALEALAGKGWISGYADGTFRPAKPLTRAEWAAMLAQLLQGDEKAK